MDHGEKRPAKGGYIPYSKMPHHPRFAAKQAPVVSNLERKDRAIHPVRGKIKLQNKADFEVLPFEQHLSENIEYNIGEFSWGSCITKTQMDSLIKTFDGRIIYAVKLIMSDDEALRVFSEFIKVQLIKKIDIECYGISELSLLYFLSSISELKLLEDLTLKIDNFNAFNISGVFAERVIEESNKQFRLHLKASVDNNALIDLMLAFKRSQKTHMIISNHGADMATVNNIIDVFNHSKVVIELGIANTPEITATKKMK